jgi:hypothetical protein
VYITKNKIVVKLNTKKFNLNTKEYSTLHAIKEITKKTIK